MRLIFPSDIMWSMAHYIPKHKGKCKGIHGHTYIVRDLVIAVPDGQLDEMGISMDFGDIKQYFRDEWDHKFLVPTYTHEAWKTMLLNNMLELDVAVSNLMHLECTTAEYIMKKIKSDLVEMLVKRYPKAKFGNPVMFGLLEGPGQGVTQ